MVEQKQAAVVGKNVSAPRPTAVSGSAAVSPVQPQRMSSPEGNQEDAPGKDQEAVTGEEEPELGWRGRRQGGTAQPPPAFHACCKPSKHMAIYSHGTQHCE